MSRLRVSEIFRSVQGEGIWTGVPSAFLRVSGCNLRCRWCDTPYASWNPEGPMMGLDQMVEACAGVDHVVVTGGEPMIFEPVVELTHRLKALGHVVTIETAGTSFLPVACDLMSLSPKLAHSAPDAETPGGWRQRHEETRANLEPLRQLMESYHCQLKFVVDPEDELDDLAEIDGLLVQLPTIPPDRIILMAEGRDAETLHRRERLLVPICLERGWRLGGRLQIDLFGDTRGT